MASDQQGATLTFSTFSAVIDRITPSGFDVTSIDTTPLATTDYRTKMAASLVDCGNVEFEFQFTSGITIPAMKTAGTMLITLSDGHTWSQSAFMQNYVPPDTSSGADDKMMATITLELTGAPTCSWW